MSNGLIPGSSLGVNLIMRWPVLGVAVPAIISGVYLTAAPPAVDVAVQPVPISQPAKVSDEPKTLPPFLKIRG